ncbi:MAG: ABC transporter substrate-binding protein [Desulfovibrio sp.]|jgi:simple sugar transport system substrate-binding protein|nr:ABC transporter substrate-binding protein [Desulfovibrio sp.]
MNKLIALSGVFLFAFILVSCNGSDNGAGKPGNKAENPEGLIVVGFSQVGAESDWRRANTRSMRETFTREKGYRLILKDAQQKQEHQIAAIRDFIQIKVNYIVLAPVTEQGWDSVLEEARDAGIPVIIMDRMIKTLDDTLFVSWVGSDFRREGGMAAVWMEKTFKDKKKLKIAHMQGSMGSSAQIGRTEGLQEGVARNAGWQIVIRDSGDFAQVKGKEVMERFLSKYRDIDVLYCENDNMAFGAIQALNEARLPYGLFGGLKIVSFDATRAGLEQTLARNISYNVECNPLHGPRVENIIQQLQLGKTPNKIVYVDETAFSADTITQEEIDARAY